MYNIKLSLTIVGGNIEDALSITNLVSTFYRCERTHISKYTENANYKDLSYNLEISKLNK